MIRNKKGMSEIVTTLIIVLLTIVALGIIWVVVKNVINKGAGQTELAAKCQEVEITATKINDTSSGKTGASYSLTLSRTGTGDDVSEGFGGEKVALFSATGNSPVFDFGAALNPLDTKTNGSISLSSPLPNVDKVQITPYFVNDLGEEQICATTITTEF